MHTQCALTISNFVLVAVGQRKNSNTLSWREGGTPENKPRPFKTRRGGNKQSNLKQSGPSWVYCASIFWFKTQASQTSSNISQQYSLHHLNLKPSRHFKSMYLFTLAMKITLEIFHYGLLSTCILSSPNYVLLKLLLIIKWVICYICGRKETQESRMEACMWLDT